MRVFILYCGLIQLLNKCHYDIFLNKQKINYIKINQNINLLSKK